MLNHKKNFSVSREFDADKQRVFDAFSTAEAMGQWWGPVGTTITVLSFDFKPGGKFHYKLEGNGHVMWGLFVFKTINSPDLLEYVSSFADAEGTIIKAPFEGLDFPLEVFNYLAFTGSHGKTMVTLHAHPINETPEQESVFHSITQSMHDGFSGTLNQLEEYLAKQED